MALVAVGERAVVDAADMHEGGLHVVDVDSFTMFQASLCGV